KARPTPRPKKEPAPGLEPLDGRIVPTAQITAAGAGMGAAGIVTVFNTDGSTRFRLTPYGEDFTGGVRVAVGDVNGDGTSDVVTAPGPGFGPQVDVFDGTTGQLVEQFMPFED